MEPALILLGVLAVVGLVLWLVDGRRQPGEGQSANASQPPAEAAPAAGCADQGCALHSVCPSEQLLAEACRDEATYYDDQELDDYRGRASDSYTPAEVDQFREVLYTLRAAEALPWHHSLQRRGVALPECLRDELIMLASDARQQEHENGSLNEGGFSNLPKKVVDGAGGTQANSHDLP